MDMALVGVPYDIYYIYMCIYLLYIHIWYICSCSAKHDNYDRRSWIPWKKKHLEKDVFTTTLNRGRGSCAGDLSGHIWEHTMGVFSITGMGLLLVLFLFLDLPHTFHLTYSQIFGDGRHFKQPRWQKKVQKEGCWEIVPSATADIVPWNNYPSNCLVCACFFLHCLHGFGNLINGREGEITDQLGGIILSINAWRQVFSPSPTAQDICRAILMLAKWWSQPWCQG
jgi:hypothetical protein